MTAAIVLYSVYLVLCTAITIWVGRTLQKSGATFVSYGKTLSVEIVDSITHLLLVGFYLMAFGAVCFLLKTSHPVAGAESAMEILSVKIGFVLVTTGIIHFYLVAVLVRFRNNARPLTVADSTSASTSTHSVSEIVRNRDESAE